MIFMIDKLSEDRIKDEILYKFKNKKNDITFLIDDFDGLMFLPYIDVVMVKDWFALDKETRDGILYAEKLFDFRLYAYIPDLLIKQKQWRF